MGRRRAGLRLTRFRVDIAHLGVEPAGRDAHPHRRPRLQDRGITNDGPGRVLGDRVAAVQGLLG